MGPSQVHIRAPSSPKRLSSAEDIFVCCWASAGRVASWRAADATVAAFTLTLTRFSNHAPEHSMVTRAMRALERKENPSVFLLLMDSLCVICLPKTE